MADLPHPHLCARGTRKVASTSVCAMVYAPEPTRAAWIQAELARADAVVRTGHSVAEVVAALLDDAPPRPQVLIADLDAIGAGELLELHQIRERWFGTVIGIGGVPSSLRSSLGIDRVLNTPLFRDTLRNALDELGCMAQTRRIPVLDDRPGQPPIAFTVRATPARVMVLRRR